MKRISYIVLIIFLNSASQSFSKSSDVYEYWLDNFLFEKIRENTTDIRTTNLITLHFKGKVKKL